MDGCTNWCRRLRCTRVSGWGQGVVNMTAPDGLGNAEATGLLVNLWTAWQHHCPQCNAQFQPKLNMIPLRKGAIKWSRYVTRARDWNRNSKLRMTCLLGGLMSAARVFPEPWTDTIGMLLCSLEVNRWCTASEMPGDGQTRERWIAV